MDGPQPWRCGPSDDEQQGAELQQRQQQEQRLLAAELQRRAVEEIGRSEASPTERLSRVAGRQGPALMAMAGPAVVGASHQNGISASMASALL